MSKSVSEANSTNEWRQPSLLRINSVIQRTGLKRSSIYARVKSGNFPAPAKIPGSSVSVWSSVEVQDWIEQTLARPRALAG